jgi:hypothetical protein
MFLQKAVMLSEAKRLFDPAFLTEDGGRKTDAAIVFRLPSSAEFETLLRSAI